MDDFDKLAAIILTKCANQAPPPAASPAPPPPPPPSPAASGNRTAQAPAGAPASVPETRKPSGGDRPWDKALSALYNIRGRVALYNAPPVSGTVTGNMPPAPANMATPWVAEEDRKRRLKYRGLAKMATQGQPPANNPNTGKDYLNPISPEKWHEQHTGANSKVQPQPPATNVNTAPVNTNAGAAPQSGQTAAAPAGTPQAGTGTSPGYNAGQPTATQPRVNAGAPKVQANNPNTGKDYLNPISPEKWHEQHSGNGSSAPKPNPTYQQPQVQQPEQENGWFGNTVDYASVLFGPVGGYVRRGFEGAGRAIQEGAEGVMDWGTGVALDMAKKHLVNDPAVIAWAEHLGVPPEELINDPAKAQKALAAKGKEMVRDEMDRAMSNPRQALQEYIGKEGVDLYDSLVKQGIIDPNKPMSKAELVKTVGDYVQKAHAAAGYWNTVSPYFDMLTRNDTGLGANWKVGLGGLAGLAAIGGGYLAGNMLFGGGGQQVPQQQQPQQQYGYSGGGYDASADEDAAIQQLMDRRNDQFRGGYSR